MVLRTYNLRCINHNFGRRYSKAIVFEAGFVGVASYFARMYTSHLKVKQKTMIVNCRWAGFFGELLVCFVAKPSPISWSTQVTIQPLLKNLLAGATLV